MRDYCILVTKTHSSWHQTKPNTAKKEDFEQNKKQEEEEKKYCAAWKWLNEKKKQVETNKSVQAFRTPTEAFQTTQ